MRTQPLAVDASHSQQLPTESNSIHQGESFSIHPTVIRRMVGLRTTRSIVPILLKVRTSLPSPVIVPGPASLGIAFA